MSFSVQKIATHAMQHSRATGFSVPIKSADSQVVYDLFRASDVTANNNGRTNVGQIRTFLRTYFDSNHSDALGGGELDHFENKFPGILGAINLHR